MQTKVPIIRIAVFLLFLSAAPNVVYATTWTVSKNCPTGSTTCYSTISAAITAANPTTAGDAIQILPGTYTEAITLDVSKGTLSISGIETARTIIQNPASGAVITANNFPSLNLSKVSIYFGNGTGILANNSTLNLSNIIFRGNAAGTALSVQSTGVAGTIDHNTFYNYQTGISSNVLLTISNNIFYGNSTSTALAVTSSTTGFAKYTNLTYNYFYNNQIPNSSFIFGVTPDDPTFISDGTNIPKNGVPYADPLFVDQDDTDQTKLDYHVKQGSTTLGNGLNTTDIGAFGGTGADTIPFPVEIISLVTPSPATSATITWSPNLAWNVTNSTTPGSYGIVYGLRSGTTTTVPVAAPATSTDITGLTTTPSTPGAPTLLPPQFTSQSLVLTWLPGDQATGYILHYKDTITSVQVDIDVGYALSWTLSGLVNGRTYDIWLTPYAQAIYDFAVFANDNSTDTHIPGVQHESVSSPVQSLTVGARQNGPDSNVVSAFPESIQALPNLPNSGCFIATAAYGYYSAPQVQLLRDFRDRYLMTNRPGRAFVGWYYRYGPVGAAFINAHPWTKPAVRVALLPLIGAALFLLKTSFVTKLAIVLCCGLISAVLITRRKFAQSGGAR